MTGILMEIKGIAALRFGIIASAFGAFSGLLEAVVVVVSLAVFGSSIPIGIIGGGSFLLIFLPIAGAIGGFVVGVIYALIYNRIAAKLGGILISVDEEKRPPHSAKTPFKP